MNHDVKTMARNNTAHLTEGSLDQIPQAQPGQGTSESTRPPKARSISALGRPLSVRQVAAMLGCSVCTVRQTLVRQGLPVFRFGPRGKLVCFENQVIAWLRKLQGEMKK